MRTANFRRQHDAALHVVREMTALIGRLGSRPSQMDAHGVTMLLAKLTGVLRIHLAQEDQLLYPQMSASPDPDVARVARQFAAEMGGISGAFLEYAERWKRADAIVATPDVFRAETKLLFSALGDRIERENAVLYPLADRDAELSAAGRAA